MKRYFKFRAYDTETGIMGNVAVFDLREIPSETIKVMQFTGLHDKNGREIYEGDIVKLPLLTSNGILRPLCTVEFMKACFYAVPINESIIKAPHLFGEDVEVIGNIHETLELLEAGE